MHALLGRGAASLRGAARSAGRAAGAAVRPAAPAPQRPSAPQRHYADYASTRAVAEGTYDAAAIESAAPSRVFVDWTVYKTKGAMTVKFIKPTWTPANGQGGGFVVDRQGKLLLEFAASTGERSYGWDQKVSMAMSATELGQIFSDPSQEHSFFHDPNMMDASAKGTVSKSLRWSAAPDGRGYFVNVSTGGSGGGKAGVSVSLSKAEYYVFETLGRYAIPYMLGIDMVFAT
ncbi:hypothetical protein Rsub_08207 [Raphidocelis subcapitata]|uniref:Uncharacterized protein n=1 Tax=Raphidocelis subcapitata TaxID=307507 RepID=A0A2V0P7C3_9CHLO|nr:hypothetical protein Rsub_08207 [Raphidocelis subcapitata]|eukprot:GBF95771.1 hypothetical protein Rsub_08207 [Raphidocelis subcapitata]